LVEDGAIMAARQEGGVALPLKNSVVSRQLSEIEPANRGTVATIGLNVARFWSTRMP